jgi:hypothetical protein
MSDPNGSTPPGTPGPDETGGGEGAPGADTEPQDNDSEGERSARLPEESPMDNLPVVPSPTPPAGDVEAVPGARQTLPPKHDPAGADLSEHPHRPSVFDALRQSRTTLVEVGQVAQRLSSYAPGLADARKVVRHAVFSFAAGLTLALMVALVFAGGTLRLMLGILAGTCATALAVFGALRLVSKLAERQRARALPGSSWLWVGAVVTVAIAGTAAFTFSIWEVTKPAAASRSRTANEPEISHSAAPVASAGKTRADASIKRGVRVGLERGVLYVPPAFTSADGQFDLVIHYHGNVELIEQSVAAAKLNALVAVYNFGEGAGSYSKPLRNPYIFDRMLETIESRVRRQLGLRNAQIRRIALSSWSAGFASVHRILSSRSRLDRVDAVLLMDGPHGTFAPASETEIYGPSIEHFVQFARRAISGRKLMVITHSAIETEKYPSTTQTTNGILQRLSLERQPVSSDAASPPPVDLKVAKMAFPSGERNWLRYVTKAEKKDFHVYGCAGNGKGDHIAHLAQMSVTVLPLLRERWKK